MSITVIDAIRFATVLLCNMIFYSVVFLCQKQLCFKYEMEVDDVTTYILALARHTNHF